jgi:SAM-dependent methyltransferase
MIAASVPEAVLDRLRCPLCGGRVRRAPDGLECDRGHPMPVRDGYVDASVPVSDLNTRRMFSTFGYQHTSFDRLSPQDFRVFVRYYGDVPFERLQGRVGLDAGCGNGRFAVHLASRVGTLAALDGSPAIGVAARRLEPFPDAVAVRGDLRRPPMRPGSFDFITCVGVLHHFVDPREGFAALVRLLAPGGVLHVYLYSRPDQGTARARVVSTAGALRRVTVRLPLSAVRAVSAVAACCLYAGLVLPGRLGRRMGLSALQRLPLRMYRDVPFRILWEAVFDMLSAPLERRYSWDEVEPWYAEAGLVVDSVRDDDGLVIVAHRPAG